MILTPSKKEKKPSAFKTWCREVMLAYQTEEERRARERLMQTQKKIRARRTQKNRENK